MNLSELKNDILIDATEDDSSLWFIVSLAERRLNSADEQVIRPAVLKAIRELMEEGKIVAGNPTKEGFFIRWPGSVGEILDRIETGWLKLGRKPIPGDIVWFAERTRLEKTEPGRA